MSNRPWREGIATKNPAFAREMPRWWAWIVVWFGLGIAVQAYQEGTSRLSVALGYTAALGLGAMWQFLSRRDLADRLVLLSVGMALAAVMMLLPLGGEGALLRKDAVVFTLFAPLIAGLVLAEQWLRRGYRGA